MQRWLARAGAFAEDAALVLLLTAMIVLASSQIFMRNALGDGFVWVDETLRLMVLWLALAGAVAASRADKHISINVLSRFLPETGQKLARILTNSFTAAVCGVVAFYAWQFVSQSREFEDQLLGTLPAWWFQIVMPVAFALMAWRYACFVTGDLVGLFARDNEADRESDVQP
ncbi:MAG: TRAP transporter small permease [Pseudomonadota bacterium]